ncbi:ABC transporter ATP-binding protein [Erysipelothrix rhusiopathiae]|uniref:ABC transporter, ATP-binding protein n=2 Tax=Erysipelothrix rhusiopathiae TaxID=1648 RepID=E7FTU4_ERYRH|nr:ABC transporter ATP-binding protein [Erysipelothrix rhusiopathiae]AGN23881.1 ABC transporter ATP-binding protein [Erysipelothrix rhusiopathiae SY1027]AMS11313.1 ABC transporter ATP-binding protein [Erysipelothrix rhusiopathiae]AOO67810.1 ABC transporter ATP-binding protein [Erysipelothrix rhusiopathiae]AWU41333.1 ABC transporter ATP-binding protein [Erysipelothrix rhusiopathiae]EFY09433.1 ABC transporter, ATP-binding protein [Erysipelothrix rhusiopathiae ATCC 19414]
MLIQISNLSKIFGDNIALDNVNLSIKEKEIVGLLGPNGAGKSTLMKCLCSLMNPSSGTVCTYNCSISSVIEGPGVYLDLTGRQNLNFFGSLKKVTQERIDFCSDLIKLGSNLDRRVSTYSMGMKQRIGLAVALLSEPDLLILDEPTNGLDVEGITDFLEVLELIRSNFNTSILLSSHKLDEVAKISDRFVFIDNGKILGEVENIPQYEKIIDFKSKQNKSSDFFNEYNVTKINHDSYRMTLADNENLDCAINKIIKEQNTIIDIDKKMIDLESIYLNIIGNKND